MKRRNSFRCSFSLLTAVFLSALSGCSLNEYMTFNLRHSFNLALPEKDWPGDPEKTLSPVQQEIFEKRGVPTYVRYWWRNNANFPTDVDPRFLAKEEIRDTKQSWVYVREGDEVIFDNAYTSTSVPISDKLSVVIKEGDPESRQMIVDKETGQVDEIWQYISTGREYLFHGDTLYKVRQFSEPVSSYLKG